MLASCWLLLRMPYLHCKLWISDSKGCCAPFCAALPLKRVSYCRADWHLFEQQRRESFAPVCLAKRSLSCFREDLQLWTCGSKDYSAVLGQHCL